jgi:hypothetical protein
MKAQSSVEFMAIFSFLLAAVIMAAVFSVQNTSSLVRARTDMEAERLLDYVGSRLDSAYLGGDGFSSNVSIPDALLSLDYDLSVPPGSNILVLTLGNVTYPRHLLADSVTGSFRKGGNTLRNSNGQVVIS